MRKFAIGLAVLFAGQAALASVVDCWTMVNGVQQNIALRLDTNGDLAYWKRNHIADTNTETVFGGLGANSDKWGFEYVNFFRAPNQYTIVQAGTTADEYKLGLSPDHKLGFFHYFDHGSGNGNSKYLLTCSDRKE